MLGFPLEHYMCCDSSVRSRERQRDARERDEDRERAGEIEH